MAKSSPRLTHRSWAARGFIFCVLAADAGPLAGCVPSLGPPPSVTAPDRYAVDRSFEAPAAEWPQDDWWRVYQDPQLNALIAEALKDGPDLRVAEARVRQAEAVSEEAGASRYPQAKAAASASEARITQSIGLPPGADGFIPGGFHVLTLADASLSYTLDFFGKNRASLAAATSAADAARADRAAARLELTIDVASAYADFIRYTEDRDTADQAVRVRQQTLRLVGDRQRNGLETRGAYSQQNATVSDAQAQVDALDLQVLQARHRIAALLGAGPDRGLQIERSTRATAFLHPYGLPPTLALNLIGRRPDIVAARLRAEAARQRIKAAKADFYPNIDLAASFYSTSFNDQNPFTRNLTLTQFGPAVSLPIFTGGQLEGAYRGARAQYDEAVANYDKTVAKALMDVADAVAGVRSLKQQLVDARASLSSDEDAYAIAKLRYQGGLSPYLNVLTAESSVLLQRQTVVNLSVQSLSFDLALVRALGGGYVEAGATHSPSTR